MWHTRQGIYFLSGLEKINNIAFLEVKLLEKNPVRWKTEFFPTVEDHLIQKRGNISIRCFVYSQRFHCWLVMESFLVWQPKDGGVVDPKAAHECHKIATCITKHN